MNVFRKHITLFTLSIFFFTLFSCKSTKVIEQPVVEIPEVIEKPKFEPSTETMASFLSEYLNLKYKDKTFEKYMYVSVKYQRLYLIVKDSTIRKYSISTAKKGIGNKSGSNKTPSGLHTIKRKIGAEVPFGGILSSRLYTGKQAKIHTDKTKADGDYVTSRIMWLQGEEPGLNKGRNMDSYNRYIYIHGTAEEGFIGEPASHGCVRMRNKDVIELFSLVDEGTPILILKY
ncbi:MAG: L,D-transpeptidase [Vicingaceae bacterium]|nr:L,D-transpeptidase [Vicingaceae bacterium]